MSRCPRSSSVEMLLNYRENYFESCLKIGYISIKDYGEYQLIANEASKENKLANYLPSFTLSLLDQLGAHGLIEYSVKKELLPKE